MVPVQMGETEHAQMSTWHVHSAGRPGAARPGSRGGPSLSSGVTAAGLVPLSEGVRDGRVQGHAECPRLAVLPETLFLRRCHVLATFC